MPAPIEVNERDRTGQFDGKWVLQSNDTLGNCKHNFTRAYLTVHDGIAETSRGGEGYVSESGDFRIKDSVFQGSSWALRIYGGNLNKGRGRVLIDYQRFQAADCSIGLSISAVQ